MKGDHASAGHPGDLFRKHLPQPLRARLPALATGSKGPTTRPGAIRRNPRHSRFARYVQQHCIEKAHRRDLTRLVPEEAERVHLLSEVHPAVSDPARAPDIFDPIGLPVEDYRRCFALVRDCIDAFVDRSG